MSGPSISDSVRIYDELKQRLLRDIPDLDEVTLQDTLEGETDLNERILSICRAALEADGFVEMIKARQEDLAARRRRHEDRVHALRALALWAMQESGIPKITAPDLTISIGKPRASAVITDEKALPLEFIDYVARVKKAEIATALKEGTAVPGATLSNSPPSIVMRSK